MTEQDTSNAGATSPRQRAIEAYEGARERTAGTIERSAADRARRRDCRRAR